jgi:hypothetical protein
MTDYERKDFEREVAELRTRLARRDKRGPVSSGSASDVAADREDAARVRRLMQFLIDDSRRSKSDG